MSDIRILTRVTWSDSTLTLPRFLWIFMIPRSGKNLHQSILDAVMRLVFFTVVTTWFELTEYQCTSVVLFRDRNRSTGQQVNTLHISYESPS